MLLAAVQVLSLALGLALAAVWPREVRPLLDRSSVVNVVTGGLLYGLKIALGMTGIYALRVGWIGTAPLSSLPMQALFAFLVVDFTRYWVHRAHHRVPFLWNFHRVHHSVRTMDSTTGFRMHVVDFLQLSVLPMLLFGVLFDTSGWSPLAIPFAMIPGIVADALEHSNTRFAPRPTWLRYVFNNPLFHSWHHVRDAELCDGNYANALPVWDLLFRSDVSQDVPPEELGLIDAKDLASDVVGLQLLRPPAAGNAGPLV